jgi:ankyrin repeat protein
MRLTVVLAISLAVSGPARGLGQIDLLGAAARGDASAVRAALAAGTPPDLRDKDGRTPLHWAAEGGHTEVIRVLLDAGAEVDAQEQDRYFGRTPLHLAAQGGHTDAIQLLLNAGAEVNAEDRGYGSKPLWYAVASGHAAAAKLLLEGGAAVNASNRTRSPVSAGDITGETALDRATEDGRADLVALLLAYGAGDKGHWPVFSAMARGHIEVMRLFLDRGADANARLWQGVTLLHETGNPEMIELLLTRGADPNARDEQGHTPLHVCAVMGWLEAARLLLDAGADVSARDAQGWTPLHYAALASRKGKPFSLDLTRLLLRHGADPGARDRDGNTPLHLGATGKTGLAAASLLLEARPDLEDRNYEGNTLLHTAAAAGCTAWASLLLEKGADPRARNWRAETPLHFAARNDLCDLAERLLDAGAGVNDTTTDGDTPLHLAAKGRAWRRYGEAAVPTCYRNVQPSGDLSKSPITLQDSDVRMETDWVLQRYYGWPADRPPGATTECLLRRGADPNARDSGSTPLYCLLTVMLGKDLYRPGEAERLTNTWKALLNAGASGDIAGEQGYTPVHLAAQGLPDVLQALLERGADPNARNGWDDTPLHSAVVAAADARARGDRAFPQDGNAERVVECIAQCVTLLLEHGADANLRNGRGGDTPLHFAVASVPLPSVVQALLDGHADITVPNSRGETPLQLAIMERQKRDAIGELLRARGVE